MLCHHRGACAVACLRMSGCSAGRDDCSLIPGEVKQGLSCCFLLSLLSLCSILQDSEPMGLPSISLYECWDLRCKPLHLALHMGSSSCSQTCSQCFFLMSIYPPLLFRVSIFHLCEYPPMCWCTYPCACGGQRRTLGVSLCCSRPCSLEPRSFTEPEAHR